MIFFNTCPRALQLKKGIVLKYLLSYVILKTIALKIAIARHEHEELFSLIRTSSICIYASEK